MRHLFGAVLLALANVASAQDCQRVVLEPYTATSPVFAAAMAAQRAGRHAEAMGAMETLLDAGGDPPPQAVLYALGRLNEAAGRPLDAIARYDQASRSELADEVLFRKGMVLLSIGDIQGARAAFAGISVASPDWLEARLALADALVREGRAVAARTVLRDLFRDDLGPADLTRARVAAAFAAAAAQDMAAARSLAQAAFLFAPDQASAAAATKAATSLGFAPTEVDRVVRLLFLCSDLASLRKDKRLSALDPGLPFAVQGRWQEVVRKDLLAASRYLEDAALKAQDPTLTAFALYSLGVVLAASGQDEAATQRFDQAVKAQPEGPFAPLAIMGHARGLMRSGNPDGATDSLARILTSYPESGLEAKARWEIALAAMMAGRHETALASLDDAVARLDAGRGLLFGLAEKVRYFRAFVLYQLGRKEEAVAEARRVARGYPHSYFAVLAASRLAQWTGELPGLGVALPAYGPPLPGLTVCPDAMGGLTLWRLGYVTEGLDLLKARARMGLLSEEGITVLAALLTRGRTGRSAMQAREYLRGLPTNETTTLFEASYSRPFETVVAEAAKATGVDEALLHAVMRAESSFEPSARSQAGAVGLMQLLPSTARLVATRVLSNPKLARGIYGPASNVLLGAAFLAELDRHFRGHLPLMLTAYNAGPGAARKFWQRLKQLPTDILVEAIPYQVTSAYVKKVIGLMAGYKALSCLPHDRDLGPDAPNSPDPCSQLLLPLDVPDELGPFLDRRRGRPGV